MENEIKKETPIEAMEKAVHFLLEATKRVDWALQKYKQLQAEIKQQAQDNVNLHREYQDLAAINLEQVEEIERLKKVYEMVKREIEELAMKAENTTEESFARAEGIINCLEQALKGK